jgi:membrane associated rhomboid family serine protease
VPATQAETDPSVCYRHPDRSSWTLCQRCGRTICPECQILTPSGVRCPDCVRETGGSVQWQPTAGKPSQRKKAGARQARSSVLAARVDASARPVITIGVGIAALVLWLLGYFTANAPSNLLNSSPQYALQVWRYVTTSFVYPAVGGTGVLAVLLGIGIFVWIGWGAERFLGWRRYIVILLVAGTGAAALSGIALGGSLGLVGPVWGIFGAYLIVVWDQPTVRNRLLITMAIWFIFSLFFGNIVAVIGGAASGIGATLLLRRYDGRTNTRPSTPYLLITAGLALLIFLAILSSTAIAPLI